MWDVFATTYLDLDSPLELAHYHIDAAEEESEDTRVEATVVYEGASRDIAGTGNGPIAAFANALENIGINVEVQDYSQRARSAGDDADAACYIYADVDGKRAWGAGVAGSTTLASMQAIVSAVNRSTVA